ncbi:hypothetical protein K493DRAFT_383934 [Basidiobolus meristosporus CBS 931.73]|uniref:Uncharacterized protein n=1 Tax=Basidiobolus meristosporus CBS 931.73 TaxID=1314790 RepID=A0A1Y1XTC8_9FUNG|nr:hypothetical protein K493DRAFT_383934 [Basidiobolus meristosporus CBS 931.73]|eukprot:ORX88990.1 hypothetical protein K493DRAFT_383934 [Basidiobolus meristosporus CBS 931.73]
MWCPARHRGVLPFKRKLHHHKERNQRTEEMSLTICNMQTNVLKYKAYNAGDSMFMADTEIYSTFINLKIVPIPDYPNLNVMNRLRVLALTYISVIAGVTGDQIVITKPLPYSVIVAGRPFNISLEIEISGSLHSSSVALDILRKNGSSLFQNITQLISQGAGDFQWAFPADSPEDHYTLRAYGDAEYSRDYQLAKVHMERQVRVFVQRPVTKPNPVPAP